MRKKKTAEFRKKIDALVLDFAERLENAQTIRDKKARGEKLLKLRDEVRAKMQSSRPPSKAMSIAKGGVFTGLSGCVGMFVSVIYGAVTGDQSTADVITASSCGAALGGLSTCAVSSLFIKSATGTGIIDASRSLLLENIDADLRKTFTNDPSETFSAESTVKVREIFNITAPPPTPQQELQNTVAAIRKKNGLEK